MKAIAHRLRVPAFAGLRRSTFQLSRMACIKPMRATGSIGSTRAMSSGGAAKVLVVSEHDNKTLNEATLNTVTAAKKLGADITVLVAGNGCKAVAEQVRTRSSNE